MRIGFQIPVERHKISTKIIFIDNICITKKYNFMKIAVFGNQYQDNRVDVIGQLFDILLLSGAYVEVEEGFYAYVKRSCPGIEVVRLEAGAPLTADVVVSVGGDGTFLRAASWVGDREIPIVGVNTGHLGYLSDVSIDDITQMMRRIVSGDYRVECRSLIEVTADSGEPLLQKYALNEVAVLKHDSLSMLYIDAVIDGVPLSTYVGDGLIVATPTGSTAYNLSVGGPIMHPACRSLVLSPVAAHSLTMRPLVVPDNVEITLGMRSDRSQTFMLSVDGVSMPMPINSKLRLRKASHCVKVIIRNEHDFAGTLRSKLMWGKDVR